MKPGGCTCEGFGDCDACKEKSHREVAALVLQHGYKMAGDIIAAKTITILSNLSYAKVHHD